MQYVSAFCISEVGLSYQQQWRGNKIAHKQIKLCHFHSIQGTVYLNNIFWCFPHAEKNNNIQLLCKEIIFIHSNVVFLPYWKDKRPVWLSVVRKAAFQAATIVILQASRFQARLEERLSLVSGLTSVTEPVSDWLQNKEAVQELIFEFILNIYIFFDQSITAQKYTITRKIWNFKWKK